MKGLNIDRLDPTSIRLALSYLAIIMVLSIDFSIIFYNTSSGALHVGTLGGAEGVQKPITSVDIGVNNGQPTLPLTVPTASDSRYVQLLQRRLATIQTDLLHRLIVLNTAALIGGSVFSYYLARRTLRPIEAAMEAQSRFTADASHELRTPLAVMQAENEVALRKPDLSLGRAKAIIRSNLEEVIKLRQLSEGLLDLTHHTPTDNVLSTVVFGEVVSEAINRMMKPAQAKHITIIDKVPKLSIQGDGPSLTQALVILLDNAIKYSAAKRKIHIDGGLKGKYAYLSIRDEGPGIRATDLPHIFERFYRADASRSRQNVDGYGLGLSIAQKIIRYHGGEITVSSSLGQGSTFTMKLPAKSL